MILRRTIHFFGKLLSRIDISFNQLKYFRAIAFMILLTTYLPIVFENLPSKLGSHNLYVLIWYASVLIFAPKLFIQKRFLYLLFYGLLFILLLLNVLWIQLDGWNRQILRDEFDVYLASISVIIYFLMVKDYKGLAWLTKWSFIFIGITAIFTIYSTSIDPMYIRKSMSGDVLTIQRFEKIGGGGYGYISALVALFPVMFYYFKNNNKSIFSKKIIVLFGLLCLFTLARAQIFANILLSGIVILLSMLGRKNITNSIITISFLGLIFLVIPKTIYAELLINVSSFFDPDSNVYYKLNDMATYLVYGDRYATGADARAERYPMLIDAFIENPLLGYSFGDPSKYSAEGGHIYWMNKLTTIGLLGFIPFIFIHIGHIKSGIKLFNKDYNFYFLISIFSIVGLGLMKALIGRELWFAYFVLLPGAYFLPLLKKNKSKQDIKLQDNNLNETQKGLPAPPIDLKETKW